MTDRFGIVACSKSKRGENEPDRKFAARDLYDSWLFDSRVAAVEAHCDEWAIMSAEHGYVEPDDWLSWYDRRIDELPAERRLELAYEIVEQLPDGVDEVMVLMGRDYFDPLSKALPDDIEVWDPLEGVRLFEQRSELRDLADTTEQATLVIDGGSEKHSDGAFRLSFACASCGEHLDVEFDGWWFSYDERHSCWGDIARDVAMVSESGISLVDDRVEVEIEKMEPRELRTDGGRSIAREHLLGATVWAYGGGAARVRPWDSREDYPRFRRCVNS